jgi:hypothetical protein
MDKLTGIERYPKSEAYGKLVCPVIMLWKEMGQTGVAEAIGGALKHGEEVEVLERVKWMGRTWCKVRAEGNAARPEQKGWVLAEFLEGWGIGEEGARRAPVRDTGDNHG